MRRWAWNALLGAALSALLPSCAGELSGDPESYKVKPEQPGCDAVAVFAKHCATGCHSGKEPAGGLDLGSSGVAKRLVGVASTNAGCESKRLIDPTDVNRSFLLEKVESDAPSCGDPMPLAGEITVAERECIRVWATALVGDGGNAPPASAADASTTTEGGTSGTGGTDAGVSP